LSNLKLGNWSESDPGIPGGLSYVVVGEGKYAIVLEDLATWTVVPVSGSPTLWDVVRGPGRFVILGSYLTIVLVDGQAPVETVDAEQYPFKGCYAVGYYWRVTNDADRIQKSADGITWTNVTVPLVGWPSLCIAAEGSVIAVGGNKGQCAVSTDGGVNWSSVVVGSTAYAKWVAGVHNGRVFFSAKDETDASERGIYFADAPYTSFTLASSATVRAGEAFPTSPVFSDTLGIVAYTDSYFARTSNNGTSWDMVPEPNPMFIAFRGIQWDGTRFVGATSSFELRTIDPTGSTVTTAHTFDFNLRAVAFTYTAPVPPSSGAGVHDLIVLPNGQAETTVSLAQRVDIRLRTFIGEHWLNPELGVPWFEEFLRKAPDPATCRQILVAVIQDVPGIETIDSLEVAFSKSERQMRVSFAVSGSDSIPQQGITAVPL
jgi:hypothetical protein